MAKTDDDDDNGYQGYQYLLQLALEIIQGKISGSMTSDRYPLTACDHLVNPE